MSKKTLMQAPKGTTSAVIEGQEYDVPKNGIIEVKNADHIETLKRHGFIEADDSGEPDFESMEDAELIAYIEERGGDADDSMKTKKLRRLAREAYEESKNEED